MWAKNVGQLCTMEEVGFLHYKFLCWDHVLPTNFTTPEGICLNRLAVPCGLDLTSHPIPVFSALITYLSTTVFVKDIDKLFDSFNSVKCAAPGKTLHSPLSDNSPHIGHWTKARMGIKSWIFLSDMPYKRCQFGCDRSILKGTFTWRTVPSQLYIGFHSRDCPETPNMAISPHALERCKFGCGWSKMKGTLVKKTKNLISFTCTSIRVFFLKIPT